MTPPADLAPLRTLVETATVLRQHLDQYMSRRAARWKWYQDSTRQLDIAIPAAQAALERVESLQAHYDAALFNWNEVITERDALKARIARLVEALRKFGVHLGDCPRIRTMTEYQPGACDCGLDAALEGRDE